MRRLAYVFAFALLVTMLSVGKADAGFEWCSEDPTFIVNGNLVDISTMFPATNVEHIKGPVVFELLVPSNTIAAVVSLPGRVPLVGKVSKTLPRWWGLIGLPVVVRVSVTASTSFATRTRVTGTGLFLTSSVNGQSNQVTTASYRLLLP
jgi:hypothetical protein